MEIHCATTVALFCNESNCGPCRSFLAAFGSSIVLPGQDAVVAITADTRNMQAEINVVWDKLLPAIQPLPLAADPVEEAKLKQCLADLAVSPVPANK
jgi:hypothetical protein